MRIVPAEQVQQTVQVLLTFLDSENAKVPGNLLDGVVSGKSLLRGLLNGQLVVGQVDLPKQAPVTLPVTEETPVEAEEEAA
jgi:hypothetical protein